MPILKTLPLPNGKVAHGHAIFLDFSLSLILSERELFFKNINAVMQIVA